MKEKLLIYHGDPCTMRLYDAAIQTLVDARSRGQWHCGLYGECIGFPPPGFGCVQLAGLRLARYVLEFYSEASAETLAMEVEEFRRKATLPPESVKAYIDTAEYNYRLITDPELVVERVAAFARAVLDLKPGERVPRSSEETVDLIAS